MIQYKVGDILAKPAEAVVNTVNCVGAMGRGIALQFKRAYPENFKAYAKQCKHGEMQPGKVFVFDTGETVAPRYIINFPTKRHWKGKSRMEDIESGLISLKEEIRSRNIRSIAVPPLGAGMGGLDWPDVRDRIAASLADLQDVDIVVFEPSGWATDDRPNRSTEVPKMTTGRAVLVALMDRYLRGLLDPFLTLLEVHKLMYFMQVAKEPLRLNFSKERYGPYAENLRHVLKKVDGHMVSGYVSDNTPFKELALLPGALDDARERLEKSPATEKRLERVFDLVDGFESEFGMELLATVHWVATEENKVTLEEITEATHDWNERKKRFTPRQIKIALDVLTQKGWIGNSAQH